jgi:molybdopterin synthase sulfur carrier subunit
MPRVVFSSHITRHVPVPECTVAAATLRAALDAVFSEHPAARDYVLDEQGHLRRHVVVFIDGARVRERERLDAAVGAAREIHVLQALTGG